MKLRSLLLDAFILFLLLVISVDALTLDESIVVSNKPTDSAGGLLYSRTDSAGAKSMVSGVGNQIYHEKLDIKSDSSIYSSTYNLTNQSINGTPQTTDKPVYIGSKDGLNDYIVSNANSIRYNRYAVRMDSQNGLSHFMDLHTKENITAVNAIVHDSKMKTVSTSYNIKTSGGDIFEGITNQDGRNHPRYLVERRVAGNAIIRSNLSDSESNAVISDQGLLSDKIDAVNPAGEVGHISFLIPSNNILVENAGDDFNFNVSGGTVGMRNGIGLPTNGIGVKVSESASSNAKNQTVPTAQAISTASLGENISTTLTSGRITFIIPTDNSATNPLNDSTMNATSGGSSTPSSDTQNEPAQILGPGKNAPVCVGNVTYIIYVGQDLSNMSAGVNSSSALDESVSTDKNISTAINFGGITFIIPNNNSATNPPDHFGPNLSIMSTESASPLTLKTCPCQGNSSMNTPSGNNSTMSSKTLNETAQKLDPGKNASVTGNSTTNVSSEEPRANSTAIVAPGGVTFLIGDSSVIEAAANAKPCVRKSVINLSTIEMGPPCMINLGKGMG